MTCQWPPTSFSSLDKHDGKWIWRKRPVENNRHSFNSGNSEGKGVVFKDEVMQGKVFASNQCAKAQGFDANPRLGFGSKSQSMQHILKRLPQKGQTQ